MKKKWSRLAAVVAALATLSVLPTMAGPASAAEPAGTPIKIGFVGTQTGATGGQSSTQVADGIDAWVKYTNANGGVNGHPVKLFVKDDKGDPAVGRAAVKDLVENDGVVAIVGSAAGITQQTWADYVLEKRIPIVDGSLIDALWFTNPMFYPIGTTVVSGIWGQMKAAQLGGAKKVGVLLCTEVAACAQAVPLFKSDAESVGLDLAYSALASQTQASYTAECLEAKNSGATAMAAFINAVVFARDCARQGYKPTYINSASGPGRETIESSPELGNSVGSETHWPCVADKPPGPIKQFNAAMKKYGHGQWVKGGAKYNQLNSATCTTWVGGEAFKKAIENANVAATATATNEDVIKGLAMFKDETLNGMAPNITLSDGTTPNAQQKCMWLYKWKGTSYTFLPKDGSLTCES